MRSGRGSPGYVLPAMLVILAAVGALAGTAYETAGYKAQRAAEEELIFRGEAYARAIARFHRAGPVPRLPRRLEDLVTDPREPSRRFIRRLYDDPLAGEPFRPLVAADGIVGVAPASRRPSVRRVSDRPLLEIDGETYADWRFEAPLVGEGRY